jgi:hypothetical protein
MVDIPQTPNFKLYKPPFDRRAWHRYINDNMSVIDAVLTTYLDVGNVIGVWQNSTTYHIGERVIDPDVGQVFEVAVNHISSAGPTTFAEDRTANPTFWTSLAVTARGLGAWQPGILYQPNDFVVDGTIYAVCITTHTSGIVFADDAVYWDYLIDVSSLPVIPSITGKALQLLRVNAGETTTEWVDDTDVVAWLGLGTAAFEAASAFASASHSHTVAELSDASANGRSLISAADYAAMRTLLGLGSLALLNAVPDDSITYAKIQNVTDARLLGRSAGSGGDAQEITVGAGLSLSGGALTTSTKANVHAHKNGTDQTNIASSDTKVTFGTESVDAGNNYDTSTSIFTAPRTADYLISVNMNMDPVSATSTNSIVIYVNGAVSRRYLFAVPDAATNKSFNICDVVSLAATDTVEFYARDNTAASNGIVKGAATETWISIREL